MTLSGIATDDTLVHATTADDERRLLCTAVLGTQEQRFAHVVAAFLEGDDDSSLTTGIVGASPFPCLSQGIVDAFAFADNDFAGESVASYQ